MTDRRSRSGNEIKYDFADAKCFWPYLPELLTFERRTFEHISVVRARPCHEAPQGSE